MMIIILHRCKNKKNYKWMCDTNFLLPSMGSLIFGIESPMIFRIEGYINFSLMDR